jgi:hypothetical protein
MGRGLFSFRGPAAAPLLDLSTLTLTQYYDSADYLYVGVNASSWPGRASAGSSGNTKTDAAGYTLLNSPGHVAPTVGANLNGIPTVQFSGGSQEWLNPTGAGTPNPMTPEAGGSPAQQKSFWYVFNWDPTGSPNNGPTAAYDNSALFCDAGSNRINIAFRSGQAQVCVYDGGFKGQEVAYTNSTWAIGMVLVDGTNVSIRVGSGAFTTAACGFLAAGAAAVTYGRSSDNNTQFKGKLASFGMAPSLWDGPTCATIYASLAARYGL